MNSAITKYLSQWAEPESKLACSPQRNYAHAVVIPLHRESVEDIARLAASLVRAATSIQEQVLVIWVVNGRENDSDIHQQQNRLAFDFLKSLERNPSTGESPIDHWIVDRFSESYQFPSKEGVGLARKIGGDIALAFYSKGMIKSDYFLTTDADVEVPIDFFQKQHPKCAAAILPFCHDTEKCVGLALYDIWLRYYRLMLGKTSSPYTFFTIGSTLKIAFEAYAMVRGFPKLNAGEDFYILNKLKKVGDVIEVGGEPLFIHSRPSDRVPFGTGVGSEEARAIGQSDYSLYDPRIFNYVREWLEYGAHTALGKIPQPLTKTLATTLERTGDQLRLSRALEGRTSPEDRLRAFHTAFDGFRTLKLVHALRDDAFPDLPWRTALKQSGLLQSETINHTPSGSSLGLQQLCFL